MSDHFKYYPTVVIPFNPQCDSDLCQDTCVYLRPETNGVEVESAMMRTIQSSPVYRDNVQLVYLANLPGEFIGRRRIIEHHYHLKLMFAKRGKRLFTDYMKREFSRYFGTPFESARIYGSFEAMKRLGYSREDLFHMWVPAKEILHLNGQTIKRVDDIFIVNYDIPAILLKDRSNTDVAVMILRTRLGPESIHSLMMETVDTLRQRGMLRKSQTFTRIFHFSRSPFEQILDGVGFLYSENGSHIPLRKIHFFRYLLERGIDAKTIRKILVYPIFGFEDEKSGYYEQTIYAASYGMGYEEAYQKLLSAKAQVLLE
ncbi:MAG TPA: hypothetical protein ENN41_10205 [Sediminispirochaeta sp.]|nr:hypothetical protein [Sediminispirochaeta sp.]